MSEFMCRWCMWTDPHNEDECAKVQGIGSGMLPDIPMFCCICYNPFMLGDAHHCGPCEPRRWLPQRWSDCTYGACRKLMRCLEPYYSCVHRPRWRSTRPRREQGVHWTDVGPGFGGDIFDAGTCTPGAGPVLKVGV
jgi:hypothetical protein